VNLVGGFGLRYWIKKCETTKVISHFENLKFTIKRICSTNLFYNQATAKPV